jgi:hypothetical protein
MALRDHSGVVIEDFNGWWDRGDDESCPIDHFTQADNIQYFFSGFETRDGLTPYLTGATTLGAVLRIHPYTMQTQESLLVLVAGGSIYHVTGPTTVLGPILTIATMTDFNCVSWAGRAYITPFFTDSDGYEKGLQNEFLYVYSGTGVARKAAGNPPSGAITVANGAAGTTDEGIHVFGVVFESNTGWLSAPAAFRMFTTSPTFSVSFTTVPISAQSHITKRHIVATKVIPTSVWNGDLDGFQFFYIPGATINDNVTTTLSNISFYDLDLLEDASHLLDNFSEIPAGVGITIYHSRLVLTTTFTDISIAYVSAPGEPEAFNQVDGVLIVPLDGLPVTNCQEFRDVLYLFKRTRTWGYSDNQDVPATWQSTIIDQGIGAPVHGVAEVLDSGGVNADFLLIADFSGLMLFNGSYSDTPLSYKIDDYWDAMERLDYEQIQIVNDSLTKRIWMTVPDPNRYHVLHANYEEGLDPEKIKWAKWIYDAKISSLCLTNINRLIVGAIE